MGAIKNLITGADASDALIAEENAHLDTLSALANAKAELFREKINQKLINAGTGTDRTIPITEIQDFISETHAYTSSNADKISDTVSSVIKGFVQGGKENVTNGVCSLVTTAITALFGSTESSDMSFEKYYIAVEGIALVRLDIMGWKRAITASSLTTKVEQVSAFVMSKSTVDIKKTDFNTFLDQYQVIVLAGNSNAKPLEIIKEAKELFDSFSTSP
jgi:hypothetical protein